MKLLHAIQLRLPSSVDPNKPAWDNALVVDDGERFAISWDASGVTVRVQGESWTVFIPWSSVQYVVTA